MIKTISILSDKSLGKVASGSVRAIAFILTLVLFFGSLELMAESFRMLNQDWAKQLLLATSNPFIGLFIGLLSTAILQSSSTVTTMLVAIVISGRIELTHAIPIVMGANIGTTITSTIVAIGHIADKSEFRKAMVAATMHDIFNILVVCIVFPLEYFFKALTISSQWLSSYVSSVIGMGFWKNMQGLESPMRKRMHALITFTDENFVWCWVVISVILLFVSIKLLASTINQLLIGDAREWMKSQFFDQPLKSLAWGALLTAGIQSSSVSTSLVVPLVATGKVEAKKAFCFLMGTNLGTTITAMLAAAFAFSPLSLSIAFAHLLFNIFGILIFFPIPMIRRFPVRLARYIGVATARSRWVGFLYLIITFFLLPFLLIYLAQA